MLACSFYDFNSAIDLPLLMHISSISVAFLNGYGVGFSSFDKDLPEANSEAV